MAQAEFHKTQGIPLYRQIRDYLEEQIGSGKQENGRLPSVRAIARQLGVNPNTVQRAYNELRKEGIVAGEVGKGTFVTRDPAGFRQETRRGLLKKTIERSLEEALALEYTIEEFESTVTEYIREKRKQMENIRLVFVECNIEQLTYFTEHLELDPHIQRVPILLEDLLAGTPEAVRQVEQADIVVTSFYHLDQMRKRFQTLRQPIIGISLEPELTTLIRIARIGEQATVGIVTTSRQCREEIRETLVKANLDFTALLEADSPPAAQLKQLVAQCGAVLVSPRQKERVSAAVKPGTPVIEFVFTPDKTSIHNLKVAILELKKKIL